jgi:hypothetical protein
VRSSGGLWSGPILLAIVLFTTRARAEGSRVALVSPAEPDDVIAEVTSRMQAELAASGFDAIVVSPPTNVDFRSLVELTTSQPGVVATFAVVRVGKQAAVDVWLSDRITGKTIVKRLDAGPSVGPRGPAVLAIRAVELLRASLLEALVPPVDPVVPPPPVVPTEVSRFVEDRSAVSRPERHWPGTMSLELGPSVMNGFHGLGTAVGAVARFSYQVRPDVLARATLGAMPWSRDVRTTTGTVAVEQELGLVELAYAFRFARSTAVIASAGAGVYHLHIQGSPYPSYGGNSDQLWSALVGAGMAGALRMGEHSAVVLDLHLLVTQREAIVSAADTEAGRSGRFIGLTTIGFWLGL